MEFVRDFEHIDKSDVNLAGGKGASLGEMTEIGIPVPSGFVILSTSFEKFLQETNLKSQIDSVLQTLNYKDIRQLENVSEKIGALILGAQISKDIANQIQEFFKKLDSKYVAIRSSATAEDGSSNAWAGQLESYLNIGEENLLENIKKCWASLFTSRAIAYRFEKGLEKEKISVAVIVQKFIESEVSGVAFSVHPVTKDKTHIVIESCLGIGVAIVSGEITPDMYVVEKQSWKILEKNINEQEKAIFPFKNGDIEWQVLTKDKGEKQKLSDSEIVELSKLIIKIEDHFAFPVDVEWVMENQKILIVQSRPITNLK